MKFPIVISLFAVLVVPFVAKAEAPFDLYADAVAYSSPYLYYPQNSLGAPDGQFADFTLKDVDFRLDLGEGEEGNTDLLLYYRRMDVQSRYMVRLLDANQAQVAEIQGFFPENEGVFTIPYQGTTPYRFVHISSGDDKVWRLDAIEIVPDVPTQSGVLPDEPEPIPEYPIDIPVINVNPDAPVRGMLIKLQNDGNAMTNYDETVYFVGGDQKRHPFPTKDVYQSWYNDFSTVVEVNQTVMAFLPLGPNVTVRPSTYLVKITTDPKTYVVSPGGTLRWITTEAIAKELYGDSWSKRVIDIPDTFFRNYTVGSPIDTAAFVDGSVAALPSGELVYLQGLNYHRLESEVLNGLRLNRPEFYGQVSPALLPIYSDGGRLMYDPTIRWPY
ncbi:hypothetical protein HYV73_03195 [Candidatus Uhrbacteria bacterium]|nr:hypothetical protein [Candidatus Uhrbacteria bacterium]